MHGEWLLKDELMILASIVADMTKVDPDDIPSSPTKSRAQCWAEWALLKAGK
jgi:hypothetical protein